MKIHVLLKFVHNPNILNIYKSKRFNYKGLIECRVNSPDWVDQTQRQL